MSTQQEQVSQRLRIQELERMVAQVGLSQVLKDLHLVCELREAANRIAGRERGEQAWHSAAEALRRVAPRYSIINTEGL